MRGFLLVFYIVLCQAVGVVGARFTAPEIPAWYRTLGKPSFIPPPWVFGPAWTVLYLLMATAAWRVTLAPPSDLRAASLFLFAVQLALNLLWSWIFFRCHALRAAFAELLLLWLAIATTTFFFARIDSLAGWLMCPYLAWTAFAGVINCSLLRLNK